MAKARTHQPIDFEKSMSELESVVEQLERGELPLEESLRAIERGVALTRTCQSALSDAEQKVEQLLKRPGQEDSVVPFSNSPAEADDSDADH